MNNQMYLQFVQVSVGQVPSVCKADKIRLATVELCYLLLFSGHGKKHKLMHLPNRISLQVKRGYFLKTHRSIQHHVTYDQWLFTPRALIIIITIIIIDGSFWPLCWGNVQHLKCFIAYKLRSAKPGYTYIYKLTRVCRYCTGLNISQCLLARGKEELDGKLGNMISTTLAMLQVPTMCLRRSWETSMSCDAVYSINMGMP